MALVDAVHDFSLAGPERHLLSLASEQVREGRAPRAATDDGDFHAGLPRVRNRFSVPLSSRETFRRWAKMMSATSATLAQKT